MAINVVCPGCFQRFSVSERFAGQKGPCPKCGQVIEIPKGDVVVHEEEGFGGKGASGKLLTKPLERMQLAFSNGQIGLLAGGGAAVLLISIGLGFTGDFGGKVFVAALVQGLLGPVMAMLLYPFLAGSEDLGVYEGKELTTRGGLCGLGLALTWWGFLAAAYYLGMTNPISWVILVPCVVIGVMAAYGALDISVPSGVLLYLVFFLVLLVLFWLSGLGWVWEIAAPTGGNAPPPPPSF